MASQLKGTCNSKKWKEEGEPGERENGKATGRERGERVEGPARMEKGLYKRGKI
jgi:hypothetical protein